MYDKKAILKLTSVLVLSCTVYAEQLPFNNANTTAYEQGIQSAQQRISLDKIREQQQQTNQDNRLASQLYAITNIPNWRCMGFIHAAKVNKVVNSDLLIKNINTFLSSNGHASLTNLQEKLIAQEVNQGNK